MRRAIPLAVWLLLGACGDGGGGGGDAEVIDAGEDGERVDASGGVSTCGDQTCEGQESSLNCCEDCGCGGGETCVEGDCACVPDRMDVSYTDDLVPEHEPCDGTSQPYGADCNAAIHRYCSGRGCATTGFGPAEHSGDVATVVCLAGGIAASTFGELASYEAGCTDASPYSLACNLAVHRFCVAGGSVTGFGLLENSIDHVDLACTSAAELVSTGFDELASYHEGCDGTAPVVGGPCNAAINRLCQTRGAVSGFGPVERAGAVLTVACVR